MSTTTTHNAFGFDYYGDPLEKHTLDNGYTVCVYTDHDAENPRQAFDHLGTVVLTTRSRYTFGDEELTPESLQTIASDKRLISLPIYMYEHSGVTINTTGFSCPWDSGQVGVIYVDKSDAITEFGNPSAKARRCTPKVRDAALRCLRAEIDELDAYITGSVYGYAVFDPRGVEVESCWGYYGASRDALDAGIGSAKTHAQHDDLFAAAAAEADIA